MFLRVLRSEFLKLKRTVALKMAVAVPAAIVALLFFVTSQSPFTMLHRGGTSNDWVAFARVHFLLWGLLALPLSITLQCALVAGLDHAENQWKALLARPVPRRTFYLAKLTVVASLLALSTAVLLAGIFAAGMVLPRMQVAAPFRGPAPVAEIVRQAFTMAALALLATSIQHWMSLRFRSFAASMGAGVIAMVIGYGMVVASQANGGWPQYFPWSLPMLVLARVPVNLATAAGVSVAAAAVVTIAGCLEFVRREVK